MESVLWSRRRLLGAVACLAAGTAELSACGGAPRATGAVPAVAGAPVRSYRSRPDLHPPLINTSVSADRTAAGYVFLTCGSLVIMDDSGEPVWFQSAPTGMDVTNLQTQQYQGKPVLTWWEGHIVDGHGAGQYVIADQSYREIRRFSPGNGYAGDLHEFVLTPAGTALVTAYQQVDADLTSVGGPAHGTLFDSIAQEVDPATGAVHFEWHSKDHVPLSESELKPTAGQPFDHFHINSIAQQTEGGDLVVSARNTWTVYRIDRATGGIVHRLGGRSSDYAQGPGAAFSWQHDARPRPGDQLTLFDDGAGGVTPPQEPQSRALLLRLDPKALTSTLIKAYIHPSVKLSATSQGSAQLLSDGHVFVGWGSEPYCSEFTQDGTLVFDASFPAGDISYRAFRFPWTGRPADAPALAASRTQADGVEAYASWNGATEVVSWRLLGTAADGAVSPVATVPRSGFETTITGSTTAPGVVVEALDASGTVLGSSPLVRL